jgi:hypothetical protein
MSGMKEALKIFIELMHWNECNIDTDSKGPKVFFNAAHVFPFFIAIT